VPINRVEKIQMPSDKRATTCSDVGPETKLYAYRTGAGDKKQIILKTVIWAN